MSHPYQAIRETFSAMRRDAKPRHRDIAEKLAISEGELIAAHVGASFDDPAVILKATRLRPDWPQLIESLEPLGEVMALTRNASCVHEKVGVYRKASHTDQVGLVLSGDIDLRIFYQHWAHGFAVAEVSDKGEQRSLQFFDPTGTAIHKIFLRPQSNAQAYADLVSHHADPEQQIGLTPIAGQVEELETPDEEIDVTGFRQAWSELRDTHEFFGLLKKFDVSRMQGLRLADPQYVQQVDTVSAHQILHVAARDGVSVMVFVGNRGMIQIHSGPVHKVTLMGPWINVLDPGFNLHLREDHVASAWVVRKPTVNGVVTSLELFDKDGRVIAMFFGERKPGKTELYEWRALIANILKEAAPCPT